MLNVLVCTDFLLFSSFSIRSRFPVEPEQRRHRPFFRLRDFTSMKWRERCRHSTSHSNICMSLSHYSTSIARNSVPGSFTGCRRALTSSVLRSQGDRQNRNIPMSRLWPSLIFSNPFTFFHILSHSFTFFHILSHSVDFLS